MLNFLLYILIFILFTQLHMSRENFAISMGKYIHFMKNDKTSDSLSIQDLKKLREIKKCYQDKKTDYYTCINNLGIPYYENPKKSNRFNRKVNYKKYKNIKHLFPIQI